MVETQLKLPISGDLSNLLEVAFSPGQAAAGTKAKTPDFVTFQGKTPEENRATLMAFLICSPDYKEVAPGVYRLEAPEALEALEEDKGKRWGRLVSAETYFERIPISELAPGCPYPANSEWARFVKTGRETVVAHELRTYENGTQRDRVLSIENPQGVYVHKYRDDLYKVVLSGRGMGFPPSAYERGDDDGEKPPKPEGERFAGNLRRAKAAIEEYGLCNPWGYFVTLTLNPEKKSPDDLEAFRKKLNQMIRNLRRNSGAEIKYLLVPELHPVALEDGEIKWHLHGLMIMPENSLVPFTDKAIYGDSGNKLPPLYVRRKLHAGAKVYHWKQYDKSFGNNIIEPVTDIDKATRYLMKYVSKEAKTTADNLDDYKHLYYTSQGLKKSEKIPAQSLAAIERGATEIYDKPCKECLVRWIKTR